MSKPRFVLIETSQQPGLVAVAEGDRLLSVRRLDEARRHARDLAPAVGDLLAGHVWQPRDVNAIAVGRGPGSYTGLRVGVMSAKAFTYAAGCGLLGLETFAVLAAQAPTEVQRLTVLADAQQDKVYVQEFEHGAAVSALRIQAFNDWLEGTTKPLFVTGPGLQKWAKKLSGNVAVLDETLWYPHAETLLQLALARWQRGERDDIWNLEPIYLRPSSAEEKWSAGEKRREGV
jgi:tRNA threonylcarbamoyladenosine biosynthesis protein TsaB